MTTIRNNQVQSTAGTVRDGPSTTEAKNGEIKKTTHREQLVLFALGDKERYGLEIQRCINECSKSSGGNESITIGSLYPALHSLEKKRLVTARYGDEVVEGRAGARRKYYKLSADGRATLDAIQQYQAALLAWQPT